MAVRREKWMLNCPEGSGFGAFIPTGGAWPSLLANPRRRIGKSGHSNTSWRRAQVADAGLPKSSQILRGHSDTGWQGTRRAGMPANYRNSGKLGERGLGVGLEGAEYASGSFPIALKF